MKKLERIICTECSDKKKLQANNQVRAKALKKTLIFSFAPMLINMCNADS